MMRKLSNIVLIYLLSFNAIANEFSGKKRINFIKKTLIEIQKRSLNSIEAKEKIRDFISNEMNMLERRGHPYDTFSQEGLQEIETYLNNTSNFFVRENEFAPSFWEKVWNWSMNALPYILLGMVFVSMLFFEKNVVAEDSRLLKGPYPRGDLGKSGHFKTSFTRSPHITWRTRIETEDGISLDLFPQPIITKFGNKKYIFASDRYMFDYYLFNMNNGKMVKRDRLNHDPFANGVATPVPLNIGDFVIARHLEIVKFNGGTVWEYERYGKDCKNFHVYGDNVFCFTFNKVFIYNLHDRKLLKQSIDLGGKNRFPYSAQQGSMVYLSGGQGKKGVVVGFDMRTRKVKWKRIIDEVKNRSNFAEKLIVKNNHVYFFTQAGIIYALGPGTGKTIWKNEEFKFLAFYRYEKENYISLGSLASNGKHVYACLLNNRLIKINAKFGRIKSKLHLKSNTCHSLIIAQDQVIFGLTDGYLQSVSDKDVNKTIWRLRLQGPRPTNFFGSPVLFEGTLYFINPESESLYAISDRCSS